MAVVTVCTIIAGGRAIDAWIMAATGGGPAPRNPRFVF